MNDPAWKREIDFHERIASILELSEGRNDSGPPFSNTHLAQHPFPHCGLATVARAQ
jgi:hypothetical protein